VKRTSKEIFQYKISSSLLVSPNIF